MAKKIDENFFNLFEIDNISEEPSSSEPTEDAFKENNYVSIVQMEFPEDIELAKPEAAQTTMFEDEGFSNLSSTGQSDKIIPEEISEEFAVDRIDEIDESNIEIDDAFSAEDIEASPEISMTDEAQQDTDPITDEDESPLLPETEDVTDGEPLTDEETAASDDFFVEPIVPSEVETEKTGKTENEEQLVSMLETNPLDEKQTFIPNENETNDVLNNLSTYEKIKAMDTSETFELPYVYHGKKGDRIRYRLSLPSKNNPKQNRFKKSVMSWIITVLVALLLAIFLRTFVFVIATVDGPSMLPTLENNEKLLVTKYTYAFSDIQRGDVIICKYGTEIYPDIYVKRVIGLSGDMVSINNGVVYINGEELKEDYTLEPIRLDMDPVYVPEGCVFVMGDNRNNSADSRKVGPLSKDLIIGKVRFIISPISKIGSLEDKK